MKVIILGSGTYQPELDRHPSSYLVKINKQNLIFDFGRGALDNLLKLGISYAEIDAIFITHAHADHSSELAPFLHIAVAEPQTAKHSKKTLAVAGEYRKKDLTIYGPRGIKKTVQHLLEAFNIAYHKPEYKVIVKELKNNDLVKGKSWQVRSYKVIHNQDINCLAYRIKSKNKILTYSGDTTECQGLPQACENADLAIIEASWPSKFRAKTHLSAKTAGKVVQKARVKKLVLTHIAPYYLKNFDIKKEVKKFYQGLVIIAKDLMEIKV